MRHWPPRVTELVPDRKDDIAGRPSRASAERTPPKWAEQLQSGALPKVSRCLEALRVVFEDIYASGISHSFLIAVPFAVLSLIAIVFLPNKPLTQLTTSERIQASEADLATVSVPEGMAVLSTTGSSRLPRRGDSAGGGRRRPRSLQPARFRTMTDP